LDKKPKVSFLKNPKFNHFEKEIPVEDVEMPIQSPKLGVQIMKIERGNIEVDEKMYKKYFSPKTVLPVINSIEIPILNFLHPQIAVSRQI
jgi:hypothetical protein